MKIIVIVLGWGLTIASVYSASFDCKKASNFAEHEVCADKELSKLDDKLSALYKKVKTAKGNWREGQLTWLKERNSCKTKPCLLIAYQTRVLFFESALANSKPKTLAAEFEGKSQEAFNTVYTPVKTQMELIKQREANSFKLIESSINKDVCSNILTSINKPREHGFFTNKESLRKGEGGLVNLGLPEMLIQTDLNFPRTIMHGKNANSTRVEEFVIDLNKDGTNEFVYRSTGYLSSILVHSSYLLTAAYDSKKYSRFGEFMMKQRELGNVSNFLWQWQEFNDLKLGDFVRTFGSQVIYEFIEFNEQYYLLATRSVIKENSPIQVAVVQLGSASDIYPACLFESTFTVTN